MRKSLTCLLFCLGTIHWAAPAVGYTRYVYSASECFDQTMAGGPDWQWESGSDMMVYTRTSGSPGTLVCPIPRHYSPRRYPETLSVVAKDRSSSDGVDCTFYYVDINSNGTVASRGYEIIMSTTNAFNSANYTESNQSLPMTAAANQVRTFWYLMCSIPLSASGNESGLAGFKVEEYEF